MNSADDAAVIGLQETSNGVNTALLKGQGNSSTAMVTVPNGTLTETCGVQINLQQGVAFRGTRPDGHQVILVQSAGPLNGVVRVVATDRAHIESAQVPVFQSLDCDPSINEEGSQPRRRDAGAVEQAVALCCLARIAIVGRRRARRLC